MSQQDGDPDYFSFWGSETCRDFAFIFLKKNFGGKIMIIENLTFEPFKSTI